MEFADIVKRIKEAGIKTIVKETEYHIEYIQDAFVITRIDKERSVTETFRLRDRLRERQELSAYIRKIEPNSRKWSRLSDPLDIQIEIDLESEIGEAKITKNNDGEFEITNHPHGFILMGYDYEVCIGCQWVFNGKESISYTISYTSVPKGSSVAKSGKYLQRTFEGGINRQINFMLGR